MVWQMVRSTKEENKAKQLDRKGQGRGLQIWGKEGDNHQENDLSVDVKEWGNEPRGDVGEEHSKKKPQ